MICAVWRRSGEGDVRGEERGREVVDEGRPVAVRFFLSPLRNRVVLPTTIPPVFFFLPGPRRGAFCRRHTVARFDRQRWAICFANTDRVPTSAALVEAEVAALVEQRSRVTLRCVALCVRGSAADASAPPSSSRTDNDGMAVRPETPDAPSPELRHSAARPPVRPLAPLPALRGVRTPLR